jgi:tRNA(fMet)-specific endonuclease VapC
MRKQLVRVPMESVCVSTVTEGELAYGVARMQNPSRIKRLVEDFLLRVTILPWDSGSARRYGQLRADLERDGRPMGNLDLMLAAHALECGAVLVTKDRAFSRIPKLKIVDWTEAESG